MREKDQLLSVSISESAIAVGWVFAAHGSFTCDDYHYDAVNNWAAVDGVIQQWATAISNFAEPTGFDALSIAMPGPFDYAAGISYIKDNRNLKSLYRQNLKQLLSAKLNLAAENITFYNDAICTLAAEQLPEQQLTLGLYFDEGFGSAWQSGHQIIDAQLWNEPFLGGKAEDFFSAKWLRKAYFQLTGLSIANIDDANNFSSITGKELLKEFSENLANYLIHLNKKTPLGKVLLGGAVLTDKVNILAPLKKRLSAMGLHLSISKSKLGNTAPLIGAAVLGKKLINTSY